MMPTPEASGLMGPTLHTDVVTDQCTAQFVSSFHLADYLRSRRLHHSHSSRLVEHHCCASSRILVSYMVVCMTVSRVLAWNVTFAA